jgi:diguanylate cyclase (GGDEF)-like protein/PAS domain S-box-containing protein
MVMARFSLRVILPIVLGSFLLLVTVVAYLTSQQIIIEDRERSLLQEMRASLNATQGTVERFLLLRHPEGVRKVISAFGSDLDLSVALVTGQDGQILASTDYREEGLSLAKTDHEIDSEIVERVTRKMVSEVEISLDRHWLNGYTSICDPNVSDRLRARRCGLLFHQIDLQLHLEEASYALFGQAKIIGIGFALAALLVLLMAHRLITLRVTRIISTLDRFGSGMREKRTGLVGEDEIATLARSVDGLLDRIVADEAALRDSEELKRTIIDSTNLSIISTDAAGVIQSFSAGAERMLGYRAEELTGNATPASIHDAHEIERRARELSKELGRQIEPGFAVFVAKAGQGKADEREWTYIRKDGTRLMVSLSVTALFGADGQVSGYVGVARDVTEEKAVVQRLRLADQVFRGAGEAILVTDATSKIVDVNPAYLEVMGFSREEVIGSSPTVAKSGSHDAAFYQAMWRSLESTGRWSGELWDRRKNGEIFPQWLTINAIRDDRGHVTNYIGIFKDVTQQKAIEQKLQRMAYYDPLTNLPNRLLFRDRLEHEIEVARRDGDILAVMFMDLDRFKQVNDSLGHDVGDKLLIEAAKRIRGAVRQSDTVARLGGDEFTLVLSSLKDVAYAGYIADKLIRDLQAAFEIDSNHVYIGASIGLAIYPHDGDDFAALTKNADTAMYLAKQSGRGCYKFFTSEMDSIIVRRLTVETGLRSALALGQLSLRYQPVITVSSGRLIGFEVLLRWDHPELGNVSPNEFIPLAEENGLIIPIGHWVLCTACAELKSWQRAGHSRLRLFVNLSARQLQHEALVDEIGAVVDEFELAPASLGFEVAESVLMSDPDGSIGVIEALHGIGARIIVDDFGTGFSSISYLKNAPIDGLKIDRSFVRRAASNPEDAAIVRAMISVADRLSLLAIAEGVEKQAQLDFLRREGCAQAQGRHYAPPLTKDDAMGYLLAGEYPLEAAG